MANNYAKQEMETAEKGHDWQYTMLVKFTGTENSSNHLSLDKETYEKIKTIIGGTHWADGMVSTCPVFDNKKKC